MIFVNQLNIRDFYVIYKALIDFTEPQSCNDWYTITSNLVNHVKSSLSTLFTLINSRDTRVFEQQAFKNHILDLNQIIISQQHLIFPTIIVPSESSDFDRSSSRSISPVSLITHQNSTITNSLFDNSANLNPTPIKISNQTKLPAPKPVTKRHNSSIHIPINIDLSMPNTSTYHQTPALTDSKHRRIRSIRGRGRKVRRLHGKISSIPLNYSSESTSSTSTSTNSN